MGWKCSGSSGPPALMARAIVDTPQAVTLTDQMGNSRTFHPDSRAEVLQIGAAYLLYAAAVRRLKAIECLMICTLEPILNPVWVALGTGELPSRAALIGGLLILCAVLAHGIYSELHKKRQDAPSQGLKARSADPPRP